MVNWKTEVRNPAIVTRLPSEDMPDVLKGQLPSHLAHRRTPVICTADAPLRDEDLALRLGLVPIKADPMLFENFSENDTANENNLQAACQLRKGSGKGFIQSFSMVAKLRPCQELELDGHAVKGVAKTHTKWSPVATSWYRMHPEVIGRQLWHDQEPAKFA